MALAIAAFGIVTAVATLHIVVRTYSPVLFWDHWQLINTLIQSHGHPALRDFWAQHNEHRILTGRLLGFADFYFFGGRNVSLYLEIFAIQFCHLFLFLFVIRRFASLPTAVYVTVAGFLTYCLFSPIQMENFVWAFETVYVLVSLAATACFAALLFHAERIQNVDRKSEIVLLLLALLFAFIAESSIASGLFTWPALVFLAFALRLPARHCSIIFVAGAVAIGAYMFGYQSPDSPQTLTNALSQPGNVFHFIVIYLARSWTAHLPSGSAWPSVAESVTTLAIVVTIVCSLWCVWRPRAFSRLQVALLANLLFVLAMAGMTALGRLQYGGLQGAIAIRYQTAALVFWGSLAVLIAVSVDWTPPRRLPIAQAAVLILMLSGGSRWLEMFQFAEQRQYDQEIAWNAIVQGRFDDPLAARIFFDPKMLKTYVGYLRQHHWGPPGEITSFARFQPITQSPRIQGYRSVPESCLGHWDEARRSGLISVSVGGWALSQFDRQPPRRVALASAAGKIIGYADVKTIRQDVAAQYPSARNVKTGWEANLTVPAEDVYHAFALFESSQTACPLPGELRIRNYPPY